MYKETIAPDIMQTEGGEEDQEEGRDPTDEEDLDDNMDSSKSAPFEGEVSVHETLPARRDKGNDERDSQDEVVGDTSAVGIKD